MIKGIYTSGSAMRAGIVRQGITANNLANTGTAGFKRDRFVLEQEVQGTDGAPDRKLGESVLASSYVSMGAGPLENTGSPLDFALQSKGFFVVADDTGSFYTRNGRFDRNAEGTLVDAQGRRLQGQGGDITLPPGTITLGDDGNLSVDGVIVDKLRVVEFTDPLKLEKSGYALFTDPNAAAGEDDVVRPQIAQGFLEQSNVDAVREMVEMIATARHYEASSRLMTAQDQSLNHVVNDIGRV
ncbi:MAG: flagellar basal-body rod protein FlgF [Calditrichaeota bacterium]|nr:flagellar basal-body rod protein FlgF [Calditrichota bacterium]